MKAFLFVSQYLTQRLRFAGLCALVAAITLCIASQAETGRTSPAPKLHFGAVDDMPAPRGFLVDQDFPQLFEPGAPWQHALSRIQSFQITSRYIMSQPEEKLQKIFAFLRQHHVALVVNFGMIPDRNCGVHVEGVFHHANTNLTAAQRVKKLGGDLQYMNIDEPFFFGHYFVGNNDKRGCRYPIEELAAGYAEEIRKVRSVFPDAQVIEDEPTEGLESPAEFGRWLDQMKKELGDGAPQSIRFDVQWTSRKRPWREAAQSLIATIKQHGLKYGVIFDGTPQDQTDEDWIRTTEGHIKAWEAAIHDMPDHVMIQSWSPHPQKLLPETNPGTLLYLVNWYCENARMAQGCR
jgi:hypothetical protein